jgi:hypothetical protein
MSRNVWLSFSEWELISNELSNEKYHSFQLNKYDLKDWKERIQQYNSNGYTFGEPQFKFERVGIYPAIEHVQSPRAVNILCRENWRSQDMYDMMKSPHSFIGFFLHHMDDVDMDTTVEEWDDIRNKMNNVIENSDKRYWWDNELIKLYKEVTA